MTTVMSDWQTAYADETLTYGGLFVRDEGSWADVVEVTDLDSATGTTDMVLVEKGSVSIEYAGDFAAQRERLRSAMSGCGPGYGSDWKITGLSRTAARLIAYAALWSYGFRDIDDSTVLTTEKSAACKQDGWEAKGRVNGEKGLRRWLRREYDIETTTHTH